MARARACQCGARPAWVPAARLRRRGRASTVRPEALVCPACGNRTPAGSSRAALAEEWNSAGWCGQCQAEPEHAPFGPEWRAQAMRMKKPYLVTLLANECKARNALEETVRGQREMIARLQVRRDRRELAAIVDRLVQRGVVKRLKAEGGGMKGETA